MKSNNYTGVTGELVNAVKQALKEIEEDKQHARVHSMIRARLNRETPTGRVGASMCGQCEKILEFYVPDLAYEHQTERSDRKLAQSWRGGIYNE